MSYPRQQADSSVEEQLHCHVPEPSARVETLRQKLFKRRGIIRYWPTFLPSPSILARESKASTKRPVFHPFANHSGDENEGSCLRGAYLKSA